MADHEKTWEIYAASWKVMSAEDKRDLYKQSLNPDCVYTDPMTRARGWKELETYMLDFHQRVPGGYFATVEFMTHHDQSIAKWEMRDANETVLGDGVSYGAYDESGRLVSMTGFFETTKG